MTPYICAHTGLPATPSPDDWCRNCQGRGYTRPSIYEAGWPCDCCNGSGWPGLRYPAPMTDEQRAAQRGAMEDAICRM